MNNNIEPHYVNYDFAKFLKEKGFNLHTLTYWDKRDGLIENGIKLDNHNNRGDWGISRPEHWQVIEWLRLNHGIWIHVYYLTEEQAWGWDCYRYKKENGLLNKPAISFSMKLQSPKESYSAAFDYIKNNNLI